MILRVLDEELYAEELQRGFGPAYPNDAGLDLRAREDVVVNAGIASKVPLGVSIELQKNTVGWLTGRSYTALELGLSVDEGKIDAGYRGEIHCFATSKGGPVKVERGDRICQLLVVVIQTPDLWRVRTGENGSKGASARGDRGLGSTGRK